MKVIAGRLGWCRRLQKYVCVYEWECAHTVSAYVCTHVVLLFGVCVCVCVCVFVFIKEFFLGAPGQVAKLLCFPPSVMNVFFLSSACSCERSSNLFLSLWLRAARATDLVMLENSKKQQRTKRNWQQSHKTEMNVLKLCTGFRPVWICQLEGGWINIFKHFFHWMMTDKKHVNTK